MANKTAGATCIVVTVLVSLARTSATPCDETQASFAVTACLARALRQRTKAFNLATKGNLVERRDVAIAIQHANSISAVRIAIAGHEVTGAKTTHDQSGEYDDGVAADAKSIHANPSPRDGREVLRNIAELTHHHQ